MFKKFNTFFIILFLVVLSSLTLIQSERTDGIDETQNEEYIEIRDESDLKKIGNTYPMDGKYIQMNDIWLSENWIPIGGADSNGRKFTGTFNGNQHSIYNLKITSIQTYSIMRLGLFGSLENATIMNVSLKNVNIDVNLSSGYDMSVQAGGLAGGARDSKIYSCSFEGIIKLKLTLTEQNELYPYVTGSGLIGGVNNSIIKYCYGKGNVETKIETPNADKFNIISQKASSYGIAPTCVTNSYSMVNTYSSIQFDTSRNTCEVGPIGQSGENSYYSSSVSTVRETKNNFGESRTDIQLMQKTTYVGWDFENIWQMNPGEYPTLKVFKPYINFTKGIEDITCENGDNVNIPIETDHSFAKISFVSKPDWLELENGVITGVCPKENKTYVVSLKATASYYEETTAEFTIEIEVPRYNVSISKTNGGTVSGLDGSTVEKGDNLRLTITPDEGYVIKSILVDGKADDTAISSGEMMLENIQEHRSLEIAFEQILFTITVHKNGGGYDNVKETIDVPYGSDHALSFSPNYEYRIFDVKINGSTESGANDGQYLLKKVKGDIVVEIIYDDAVYKITATTKKGEFSETVVHEVKHGKSKEFYFAPEVGHFLEGLFIDGARFTTAEINYLFDEVISDRTIEIRFERITFQIQIDIHIDGETKNREIVNVYFGDDYNFGIGRSGYDVSGILVDGRTNHDALSTGNLLLENIQGNKQIIISYHTLKEDFTAITYTFYALDVITALALIYLARLYLRIRI